LTPASGRQDHTTSPSAKNVIRRLTSPRPPHPAPTFVTIAKRPSDRDGIVRNVSLIWGLDQWRRLRQIGTTGKPAFWSRHQCRELLASLMMAWKLVTRGLDTKSRTAPAANQARSPSDRATWENLFDA